jgi:hypothetical protein
MRLFLPLLPLPVLAALFALSCTRTRSEEPATHVIPPPAAYSEPAARNAAAAPPRTGVEEAPTAEDVKEFLRPVAK